MAPEPGHEAGHGVLIVLSSYNGRRFIAEQIESIRRQTLTDWTLLVRDDGSSDDTVRIVESIGASDSRMSLLRDDLGQLGPARSFGVLMEAAVRRGAAYVAFADQDDVWHLDKLERELALLQARERDVGGAVPLLVHSDLTVVDTELRPVHPSFLAFQGIGPDRRDALRMLLTHNFVTGCTTVINQPLLRAALPLPEVVMHDWWLALCAAALGEILCVPGSTVLYRQHGGNAAGSRGWLQARFEAARHPVRWWRRSKAAFSATLAQSRALAWRVEREARPGVLAGGALGALKSYCDAFSPGTSPVERLRVIRRYGIGPRSISGSPLFFYARVVLEPSMGPRRGMAAQAGGQVG